jgi:chromate transporter
MPAKCRKASVNLLKVEVDGFFSFCIWVRDGNGWPASGQATPRGRSEAQPWTARPVRVGFALQEGHPQPIPVYPCQEKFISKFHIFGIASMTARTSIEIQPPTFSEALRFWFKLGFISFGGPAGQIAIMHQFLVDEKKWISDSRFLHGLNYCMILPGPEAQQLATYIGWLLHGTRGGLAAGILFILPSIFILLGLSIVYVTYGKIEWVASLFYGLTPAVIAIVIVALLKIATKSLLSSFHYLVAAGSFIAIFFFDIPFPVIIVAAIAIGWVAQRTLPQLFKTNARAAKGDENERGYYLNKFSAPVTHGLSSGSVITKIFIALVLAAVPLFLFWSTRADAEFWFSLSAFFTQAAFVTFGGAYAVLPYVAQMSVEKFQWLTEYQMIDGLALGETTPGPLIMVLVFVGFMAAYNHGHASITDGTFGLLTTTFYTFLPSFLFIFIGAPFVEKTKENEKLKMILSIVTAGVVGVILNLTIYLGKAVILPQGIANPDWFAVSWLIISLVAWYGFKVNMILWIGVSALAGLLHYLLFA